MTDSYDYYELGYGNGKRWAENLPEADADQRTRACDFDIPEGDHRWNAPWSGLDWFAFHVLGAHDELAAAEMSEDFWNDAAREWPADSDVYGADAPGIYRAFIADEMFDEDNFLRGFVSGAQDAFADSED